MEEKTSSRICDLEEKFNDSICDLEVLLSTTATILMTATMSVGDGEQKDDLIRGARRLVEDANTLTEEIDKRVGCLCIEMEDLKCRVRSLLEGASV